MPNLWDDLKIDNSIGSYYGNGMVQYNIYVYCICIEVPITRLYRGTYFIREIFEAELKITKTSEKKHALIWNYRRSK